MHACMHIYADASWSYVRSTYESGDSATFINRAAIYECDNEL